MPPATCITTPADPSTPKYRPRLQRTYQRRLQLVLQPREIKVLCHFEHVKLATTSELFALFQADFESRFVFERRLKELFDAGFVARPSNQNWWRILATPPGDRRRGNADIIYAQSNRGARYLRHLGYHVSHTDWNRRAKELQPFSLQHPLLVSRLTTCATLGLRGTDGFKLLAFYPENTFRDQVTFFDGLRKVTLPIQPDGLWVVQDCRPGGERLGIFAEAERTVPLRRSTFRQTSFYRKALAYRHYWTEIERVRQTLGIAIDDFIVATVGENSHRTAQLRELVKTIDPLRQGTNLFYFTDAAQLSLEQPERFFFGDIWTSAADEQGSIFARASGLTHVTFDLDTELHLEPLSGAFKHAPGAA